jgi:hypothetical protein
VWRQNSAVITNIFLNLRLTGSYMPKLYEYFGLIVLFYSNEHEPIHVHGKYQGTESKAEIIMDNGEIAEISYSLLRV